MNIDEVLDVVFCALRESSDERISDVTIEVMNGETMIVLTVMDDNDEKEVWLLDSESVCRSSD
jgi:hypothetical protein